MKYSGFAFLLLLPWVTCAQDKEFTCVVEGQVMNAKSTCVKIVEYGKDFRFYGEEVPVDGNGRFTYSLKDRSSRLYEVILCDESRLGMMRTYEFVSEPGTVRMKIYRCIFGYDDPENLSDSLYALRSIKGGPLTSQYLERQGKFAACTAAIRPYDQAMDDLYRLGRAHSPQAAVLNRQMEDARDSSKAYRQELLGKFRALQKTPSEFYSPQYLAAKAKADSVYRQCMACKYQDINKNADIVSYILLAQDALSANPYLDTSQAVSAYKKFANKYPLHPYTVSVGLAVNSLENVQAGKPFTDFTAKDLSGAGHTLSAEIMGKVAVLDLWASWCGPCIEKGMKLKLVYEKYKDKGFTVVGVAREFKNTGALEKALERTKYPWLNLIELDDEHRIWEKYGVSNGGGGIFLIGRDGKIVAVDPTTGQIEAYLEANIH